MSSLAASSGPQILALQHIHCEPMGVLENVLVQNGIGFRYLKTFDGQSVPASADGFAGLVVMGGPMGVYEQDQHPHLSAEIRLIQSALRAEIPVLGICLGSQLLAAALGAKVVKGRRKEIGWLEVRASAGAKQDPLFSDVSRMMAFHWHGDVFDLPPGAAALASSDLTEVQAFRHGKNAYGFLFHMEVTRPIIASWISEFAGEVKEERVDAERILSQSDLLLEPLHRTAEQVLGRWASLVKTSGSGRLVVK